MSASGTPGISRTAALSSRAARHLWLNDWARRALDLLPWAMGIALVLVIVDRRWVGLEWWWGIPVILAIGAAVTALLLAYRRRKGVLGGALWLDESAHNQSRFRSALELANQPDIDPGFARIAIQSAERVAGDLRIPNERPIIRTETPRVYISALLVIGVVVAGLFVPLRRVTDPVITPPSPMQIADAREEIESRQDEIESIAADIGEDDELVEQALEDLAELEEELAGTTDAPDPESSTARAASRVDQLADELDERAREQEQQEQELRDRLDAIKDSALSDESDLDRFRERLAEGDYEDAMRELEALEESLDSMTPEQRSKAAEDLESLAEAINQDSPPSAQESGTDPSDQSESTSPDQGGQDTAEQDPPEQNPAERLSEALEDQAQRIREHQPETETEQDQEPPSENPSEDSPASGDEPDQNNQPQQDGSGESPQDQAGNEEQQNDPQSEQTGDQQGGQENQQPGEQGDQQESSESEQEQPDGSQPDQPSDQPSEQQGNQQGNQQGEQQGNQEGQQEGEREGQQDGQPDSSESPRPEGVNPTRDPNQSKDGRSKLREALEDAQRNAEGAQKDRSAAERLREQIERSSRDDQTPQQEPTGQRPDQNQTDPEQQQGSDPSASEQTEQEPGQGSASDQRDPSDSSSGGAGTRDGEQGESADQPIDPDQEFVPVQAGDDDAGADESSTPVGKWYNPDDAPTQGDAPTQTAQRFRKAAQDAREQVEDRRVPRRYRDVISKYFRQLDERAKDLAPSSDGADAPAPKKAEE